VGVEEGRLGFDQNRYWLGENPLEQSKVDLLGRHQTLAEQQAYPGLEHQHAFNAMLAEGMRTGDYSNLQRAAQAATGAEPGVVVMPGMGITRVTPKSSIRQEKVFSMYPPSADGKQTPPAYAGYAPAQYPQPYVQ
jgi:hypothetical protein